MTRLNVGQRIDKFPGETWNWLVDGREDQDDLRALLEQGPPPEVTLPHAHVCVVKNASGTDAVEFGILGVDNTAFEMPDIQGSGSDLANGVLLRGVVLEGVTPSKADHAQQFCVTLMPIKDGRIGWAVIGGLTYARVDVTDENHQFCELKDGDGTKLTSVAGGFRMWRRQRQDQTGSASEGEQWSVVNIGGGDVQSPDLRLIRAQAVGTVLATDTHFMVDNIVVHTELGEDPRAVPGDSAEQLMIANFWGTGYADDEHLAAVYTPGADQATAVPAWQATESVQMGDERKHVSLADGLLHKWESPTARTTGMTWDAAEEAAWTDQGILPTGWENTQTTGSSGAQTIPFELRANKVVGNLTADVWLLDFSNNRIAEDSVNDPTGSFAGHAGDPNPANGRGAFGKATVVQSANALEPSRKEIIQLEAYPRFIVCQPNTSGTTSVSADVKWQQVVPSGGDTIDLVATNVTLRRDSQMVETLSDTKRYHALLRDPTTSPPTFEALGVDMPASGSGLEWYRLTTTLTARSGLTLGTGQGIIQALNGSNQWADNSVSATTILNNSLLEIANGSIIVVGRAPDSTGGTKPVYGFGDVGDLPGYNASATSDHITVCGSGALWAGKGAVTDFRYQSPNFQIEVCSAWSNAHTVPVCS